MNARPLLDRADRLREFCGLFGIFGHPEAARVTFYGLFSLQHRGQESAGIAAVDPTSGAIRAHLAMGLVGEVFDAPALERIRSRTAIGHVRYSTTGGSVLCNAQPMVVRCARGEIGVAHNGNLTNTKELRRELEEQGSIFQSSADSEAILHLYARPSELPFEEHLLHVLRRIEGAFSLLFITPHAIVATRDPHGWRPLWLGKLGDAAVFASETCALDIIGAARVREVEPGEMVVASAAGIASYRIAAPRPAHCLFEHVYFARPDSAIFGDSVHEVRKRLGRRLAEEHPADADVVIPIPDSGNIAAIGYSEVSGIPYDQGFVRSHYVGRTFIKPSQAERSEGVSMKLAVVRAAVEGKRVVVIDDSVVRGTTARSRVRLLRAAGAREVHLRISCPPIRHPCFFGIDFPTPDELIANQHAPAGGGPLDVKGIARELEATSLGYLSLEGMLACVTRPAAHYCTACWSGRYPVPVPAATGKFILEPTGDVPAQVTQAEAEARSRGGG